MEADIKQIQGMVRNIAVEALEKIADPNCCWAVTKRICELENMQALATKALAAIKALEGK